MFFSLYTAAKCHVLLLKNLAKPIPDGITNCHPAPKLLVNAWLEIQKYGHVVTDLYLEYTEINYLKMIEL